jgi:predicted O-methyltransferase YrrM
MSLSSGHARFGEAWYGDHPETPMLHEWERSDKFHNSFLHKLDPILDDVLSNSAENGLPDIAVSASEGKFLHLIARSINAKNVIEVGTLGG